MLSPSAAFDADEQLGNPRVPDDCQKSIEGMRMVLQERAHEIPDECR